MIEELNSVFDPKGGYFKPKSGGKYMNSIVAEIGYVIELHLGELGITQSKKVKSNELQIALNYIS